MSSETHVGRRQFIQSVAAAPAVLAQRNPNDKIGVAMIGVGTRGHYLLQQVQECPNTEVRIICDLYQGNIKRAKEICKNSGVRIVPAWEKAVDDRDVDAVIIATPDFWHAPQVIRAARAKKDIYVEKGWCRTMEEAKGMRKAIKENQVVMQLGHNYNSMPVFHKAREIYRSGQLGKVPLIRTYIDRTSAWQEWKFYGNYSVIERPKDASPETIDWDRFLENAPRRAFDAERFFTWRCWWEYGTGIAGDLLSHLWDCVNGVAGMGIPETAVTQGGQYFWKQDRETPDMWHVLYDYPKQELAVTFNCSFHNRHVGEVAQFLGREATLEVNPNMCRTYGGEWKPEFKEKLAKAKETCGVVQPDYEFKKGELEVTNHMQNFLDCIRSRAIPRCGVDRAFEEAAAVVMSVEAYKQERKVRWDAVKEEIV